MCGWLTLKPFIWRVSGTGLTHRAFNPKIRGSSPLRVTIWLAPYPPAKIGKKEHFIRWYGIVVIILGCQPRDRGSIPRITAIFVTD